MAQQRDICILEKSWDRRSLLKMWSKRWERRMEWFIKCVTFKTVHQLENWRLSIGSRSTSQILILFFGRMAIGPIR